MVMVIHYLLEVVCAGYVAAVPFWLYDVMPTATKWRIVGSALGGVIIWIPYFLRSRRVVAGLYPLSG